jgi:Protein of unknown function (DUF3311)
MRPRRRCGLEGRPSVCREDELSQPAPQRKYPPSRILAAVLLLVNVVALVWVPIYARTTPKLGDFPFFYWYLLIWVPLSGIFCFLAYLLTRRPAR